MNTESFSVPVRRFGLPDSGSDVDRVAVEEPLEIRVATGGGDDAAVSIAITMRTPGRDMDLVAGFLLTEGVVTSPEQIAAIRSLDSNIVCVEIDRRVSVDFERLRRNFYATSSCGVCGKASLEALKARSAFSLADVDTRFDAATLSGLPAMLAERQAVFSDTGGLHAAAAFDPAGNIGDVREDIGRHNTVDKLVGAALRADRLPLSGHGILVSGRAGFEIVQKALMAGCPLVAAVGAPSSLAVELAWEFDLSLIGFLRDGRFNVYAGSRRIR